MTCALVAGIDSSTQSTKVELRDLVSSELIGFGSAPHPPVAPPRSEQDPERWWDALVYAFRTAWAQAQEKYDRGVHVVALSVAGQCHGLVALDAAGNVIRPAKLWNDTTSAPELAQLRTDIGDEELILRTGSLPTAAFTLSKVAWLARYEPDNFRRMAHILLPHDYLTYRLTGQFATDRSEASGTAYYDAANGTYVTDFLKVIDPSREWDGMLPRVLGPDETAGTVHAGAAKDLGVDVGIPVAAGGGDQHAAALGMGLLLGDVVYSFGTSGVVFAVNPDPVYDRTGLVNGVADMTGGYLPLICTLNAAKVTDSFARFMGVDHDELSRLALAAGDSEEGPALAAFLDGERTPNRPNASGLLTGFTSATSREALARSAFEGVILGLVTGQQHIEKCGVDVSGRVLAVGGGTRSPAYTQILATLLGRPVHVADAQEATARGSAIQAAAVARQEPVVNLRTEWQPATRLAAEPRESTRSPWEAYTRAAECTVFDRPPEGRVQ